jgi:putative endonuclease
MTVIRQKLGRRAEQLVARNLVRRGYAIVDRNVRVAGVRGELDLIAIDRGAIVFVEVKARSSAAVAGPETPLEMVGARKRAKIRALAGAWLGLRDRPGPRSWRGLRFDVIGVTLDRRGAVVEWRHVVAAF